MQASGTQQAGGAAIDWVEVIGEQPETFADSLSRMRPEWVTGSISFYDTRFLFRKTLESAPRSVVEIRTSSGFSTATLAHALRFASEAGIVKRDFLVVSYDGSSQLYYDASRMVGDAAREILPSDLLKHLAFRNPAMAVDVREDFDSDSIDFLLLDAHHGHPWPTLDLLATLDQLRAGAVVVMHDINLPVLHPQTAWGAKHAFDDLDLDKDVDPSDDANIGSFVVPRNKARLRDQLLTTLYDHPWEIEVRVDLVTRATA
jgi:predicted O-methyltransferase YrrM